MSGIPQHRGMLYEYIPPFSVFDEKNGKQAGPVHVCGRNQ
jgi:hypothetical protein